MTELGATANGATASDASELSASEVAALAGGRLETASDVTVRWEMQRSGEDRRAVSRRLLREELQAQLATPFQVVQQCVACGSSEHGALRVEVAETAETAETSRAVNSPTPPPLISVSYAGLLTVVAIAPPRSRALGIDVEYDTSDRCAAVQEALGPATDGTARSVREWTRLEAIAKARGRGLRGDWERGDWQRADPQHSGQATLAYEDLLLDTTPGSAPAILNIALG